MTTPLPADRPRTAPQEPTWEKHVACTDANLAEVDRGLRSGFFGLNGQQWANSATALTTIKFTREIVAGLLEQRASHAQEIARLRELNDIIASGKSPCGHWSAYAVTSDGGKHITCLQCRAEASEARLTALQADHQRDMYRLEAAEHNAAAYQERNFALGDRLKALQADLAALAGENTELKERLSRVGGHS